MSRHRKQATAISLGNVLVSHGKTLPVLAVEDAADGTTSGGDLTELRECAVAVGSVRGKGATGCGEPLVNAE